MSASPLADNAEACLLGSAMGGYRDIDELADIVAPADFYLPFNGQLWSVIVSLHRSGTMPDAVHVRAALDAAAIRYEPTVLVDYLGAATVVASAPYYAKQIAKAAGLVRIKNAAAQVHQLAEHAGDDLDEVRERARGMIDEATKGRSLTEARTLADILPEVIDHAQFGGAMALSTPWPDIDRLIGGLAPGRLVVVGARPGVGKSLMGVNIATHFARHHEHAVLLSSLEMSELEVGQRILAHLANVDLTALMKATLVESDWKRVGAADEVFRAMPITVDTQPVQTVTAIARAARNIKRVREDLAVIVVDYLQLVKAANDRASRAEQLGEISRGLKILAKESNTCVVAMAQVNREGVKSSDGRPRLHDLRESGSIEADADQVILLHQDDPDIPELDFNVAKNRHGPRGYGTLRVVGHYAHLASVEWRAA